MIRMIRNFFNKTEGIIEALEQTKVNIKTIFFSMLAIVSTRFFFEAAFLNLNQYTYDEFIASHTTALFLFFLFSYVLLVICVFLITKEKISRVASVVLWGQWLMILPPIIDYIVFDGKFVWSFYIFDSIQGLVVRFFTFFGDNPAFGITFGTRVEVLIVTILLGIYIFIKRGRKLRWLFVGLLFTYVFSFTMGIVPNLITYVYELFLGTNILDVNKTHIIKLFLTSLQYFEITRGSFKTVLSFKMAFFFIIFLFVELLVLQLIVNKKRFFELIKNVRYPQMIFNTGLMLIGICLGIFYFPKNFSIDLFSVVALIVLWIAVFSAWYWSVFVNDLADVDIDKVTNSNRPLIKKVLTTKEFDDYSFVFLAMAILAALVVSNKVLLLICLYLLLTWVYSQKPFRLKRYVFVSSLLSSFASLLFLIMGYVVVSEGQSLTALRMQRVIN
jgi:hypothetical protein